jgi:tRNA acetyltransferase TAN1
MLEDFNLLISTSRGNERNVCSEIWYLLSEVGDRNAKVDVTNVIGLVVAKTSLDPIEAVNKLRKILIEKPWEFRYTLKVTPIEKVVPTGVEEIKDASLNLISKIGKNETFRVTVEKRHTDISSRDLINAVAEHVDRKVNLDNPNRIILIEVIGKLTGVSVIKPSDILAVEKEKRAL